MNKQTTSLLLGFVAIVIAIAGLVIFSGDDDEEADEVANATTAQVEQSEEFPLDFSVTNLEPLSEGIYEGWIVRGDDKFSFAIDC